MTMVVTCPRCATTYEATGAEIAAGTWRRRCPGCPPPTAPAEATAAASTCEGCGRPLRADKRTVCARCLGGAA